MAELSIDIKHYQKCCLIIADEIHRICKKHGINYSIDGGTMLGAVRHKGFIPWDDDMDISMIREEYERFLNLCEYELSDNFRVLNWNTDKDFPFGYTKITLKGTHIDEAFTRDNPKFSEIFVDVFPFDKIPLDRNERVMLCKKAMFIKRILWMKKGYGKCIRDESFSQRIKYNISKVLFSLVSYDKEKEKYINLLKKYNELEYKECYLGNIDFPETFLNDCSKELYFDKTRYFDFEDRKYLGFCEYEKYLSVKYGDYMTMPPESDRINHEIKKVDFGIY